eukprot:2774504-Heterocapsa_arctica.AAC.1
MDSMCISTSTSTRPTTSPPPRWTPPAPPKSKGKGKSKAATMTFGGVCRRCGRRGHKQADCFARVQGVYEAEDIPVPDNGEEEIADDDYEESQVGVVLAIVDDDVRSAVDTGAAGTARSATRPARWQSGAEAP